MFSAKSSNLGKLQSKRNTNKHHSTNLPYEMRMLRITSHVVPIISFSHFHRSSLTTFSHLNQIKSLSSHTNLPFTTPPPHTPPSAPKPQPAHQSATATAARSTPQHSLTP